MKITFEIQSGIVWKKEAGACICNACGLHLHDNIYRAWIDIKKNGVATSIHSTSVVLCSACVPKPSGARSFWQQAGWRGKKSSTELFDKGCVLFNPNPYPILKGEKIVDKTPRKPDPVAEMAKHFEPEVWAKTVANYDPNYEYKKPLREINIRGSKPRHFLLSAFCWIKSTEGEAYWDDIYHSLKEKGA